MKIKLYFSLTLIIISFTTLATIIYGKITLRHINYDNYKKGSMYTYINSNEIYDFFPEIKDFIIDDEEILSINSLIELSDYVLLINTTNLPRLHGKGIINNCIIKKIIKGENLKVNDYVNIYDLTYEWNINWTGYLGGSTPLEENSEYLVFLKKSPFPTIENTFVFDSIKYGHIKVDNPNNYLLNYKKYSYSVNEISKYNYVFEENYTEQEIENYKRIIEEALKLL